MKKLLLTILLLVITVSAQAGMIIKIPDMFGDTELYCKVMQVNLKNTKVIDNADPENPVETTKNPMTIVLTVYLQKGMQQIKKLVFHREYDSSLEDKHPINQAYNLLKADPEGKFVFVRDKI